MEPRLDTPKARRYRTESRRQSAQGPNVNGHDRCVNRGCGSRCLEVAVVDLTKGKVWFAPTEACATPDIDKRGSPVWIDARIEMQTLRSVRMPDEGRNGLPGRRAAAMPPSGHRKEPNRWEWDASRNQAPETSEAHARPDAPDVRFGKTNFALQGCLMSVIMAVSDIGLMQDPFHEGIAFHVSEIGVIDDTVIA